MNTRKLKYYWFLFRWFLIGKYHCDIPQNYKKYWRFVGWIMWSSIIFFVLVGFCSFLNIDLFYKGSVLR